MSIASHWVQGHPITFAILLFAASALISLYGQEIKTFIHTQPTTKWRTLVLNDARERLALLNDLHDNAYRLTLWFISSIVHVILTAIWANFLIFFIFLALEYPKIPSSTSVTSTLIGVIAGQAWRMRLALKELYNYDRSVEELKERIARYEQPAKG